jgi:nicotinamide-nucleotide amidase
VDDDRVRIIEAVRALASKAAVVVSTGGLGPTTDDITAESVAEALGVTLVRDEETLEKIKRRWSELGRTMPESNVRQADVPKDAAILANANGTAPGFAVSLGQAEFFFMPGVPREMKGMFEGEVAPRVREKVLRTTHQIHLRTFGLPESEVQDRLRDVEAAFPALCSDIARISRRSK